MIFSAYVDHRNMRLNSWETFCATTALFLELYDQWPRVIETLSLYIIVTTQFFQQFPKNNRLSSPDNVLRCLHRYNIFNEVTANHATNPKSTPNCFNFLDSFVSY